MKNLLLTGRPGVGKTTVLQAVAVEFLDVAGGFTTAEIRERGSRVGFQITSLSGETAVLSHVNLSSPVLVGKYAVDVPAFERIALPALRDSMAQKRLIIIYEIGKMVLASPRFCDLILEVFDYPLIVVATVMEKPHAFVDRLKRRTDVRLIEVTPENRGVLPKRIAGMVREGLQVAD